MSIIVKGMEMPKSCDECPLLTEDGDYDVCFVGKRRVMWEWKYDRGSEVLHPKTDWCPLVEVPPHGRLIDADKLLASFRESINGCHKWANEVPNDTMFYARVSQALGTFVECALRTKGMPTIIPADKGGET